MIVAGLLIASAIGCVLLLRWPQHGVRELLAATLTVAPLMALIALWVLR